MSLNKTVVASGYHQGLNLKVDLIITDYCMPGMSGYDLLKRIKVVLLLVKAFFFHPKKGWIGLDFTGK